MKATQFFNASSLISASLLVFLSCLSTSEAQAASINAQTLNPSVSDHYVLTEDAYYADWPKYSPWYIGVNYNYVNNPLTAISQATNATLFNIINSIQTFDLMVAYKATSRIGFYIGIPIDIVNFANNPGFAFPSGQATAIGDLKLMAKVALSDPEDSVRWALAPELHLPTGSTDNYVSDGTVYGALRLVAESWLGKNVEVAANVGYGYAPGSSISNQSVLVGFDDSQRLMFGIGSLIKFSDRWGANVEFAATELLPTSQSQNPNDIYVGLRWMAADCLILTAGGDVGKLGGTGGQNYRGLAGLRYSPGSEPKAEPTPSPTPIPTPFPVATPAPTPVPIVIKATKEKIELLRPILFENDSAKLMTESRWILDEVVGAIHKYPKRYAKLYVDGHTNHLGSHAHNQKLSENRAKSVREYLISRGIKPSHLQARGFGMDRPIYKRSDPRAIEGNRRVEFLVPKANIQKSDKEE